MNVLGLSAFFHESACCLLRDGRLAAVGAYDELFARDAAFRAMVGSAP